MENTQIVELKPMPLEFNEENWKELFKTALKERIYYKVEDGKIQYSQIIGRIIGTPLDRDTYYNDLYEIRQGWVPKVHVLSEDLDKTFPQDKFQLLQEVLMIQRKDGLSLNRMIAFLEGRRLLPIFKSPYLQKRSREIFTKLLVEFEQTHQNGFNHPNFQRFLTDLIKWLHNHLEKWANEMKFHEQMPRILWYGDATESQTYFLYFLILFGCDVLAFHPDKVDIFQDFESVKQMTHYVELMEKTEPRTYPQSKVHRASTVAYTASREIERVLNHENSSLYKPWQFRDYISRSITLKTTYDELFIMAKERAFIRPNFQVANGEVQVPSIFAKISGITRDKKEYWDRLQTLTKYPHTMLIKQFPFTQELKANYQFHYQQALGKDGRLDPEKIIRANWWTYRHLPVGLQKGIANAIARYCETPMLMPNLNETEKDVKLYLFQQASVIPPEFIKLLERFDYPQEVPKIILYNTEMDDGDMIRSDAAMLLLLNQLGFDIVVYNPPAYTDIENFIQSEVFDNHWLEEKSFEQHFKENNGLFQRIIKKLIQ